MKLFQTLKTVYPDSREQIRRSIADIIDRERKYWNELSDEELSELLDFHRLFEGSSLHDRLLQFVGPGRFGEEPLDFAPLAEELLASETLAHEWQWLTSGEADSGWAFGAALAEQDNSEKIAELDWLLQNCGPDHRVTCGYVSARKRRDPRWFKEWYKTLAKARPDSIALVLEVAWRCGVDETTADVLTSTIRDPLVTEEAVSRLEYGAWVELLSPKATSAILVALIERDFVLVAVAILQHRVSKLSEEKELWLSPAKSLLLHPRVIRSGHMASYHWKVLAKSYLPVLAPELAKSILAEQARKDEEHWFLEHSDAAEILKKCVEMAPGDVWRAVASLLTSENEAAFLAIGFPKEILGMLPRESLLEWAEEQKDTRPQLLARLVPTDFAATQPFAIALLERFDSNEDVKKQLFGAFTSGSWIGEASNHWEELARELDGALDKSSNPVVIQWAKESAQTLRDMASRDRSREEEESLRGRG